MPRENKESFGPSMVRSRTQLMSAYAPGSLFTFEGGLGACRATPTPLPNAEGGQLSTATCDQLTDRIHEIVSSWFVRAMSARQRDADKPVLPGQCLDRGLLDRSRESSSVIAKERLRSKLGFVIPTRIGYEPHPLTMVCKPCGLVRFYKDPMALYAEINKLRTGECMHPKGSSACGGRARCDWQQLDVLFVHWSGGIEPASPRQYHWNDEKKRVTSSPGTCQHCESEAMILDRGSPNIGYWRFVCASCGIPQSNRWVIRDRDTLTVLRGRIQSEDRGLDALMEATSYRASVVHYPQGDTIIDFKRDKSLRLLRVRRIDELREFIGKRFGYVSGERSYEDVIQILEKYPEEADELEMFKVSLSLLQSDSSDDLSKKVFEDSLKTKIRMWEDRGLLPATVALPGRLNELLIDAQGRPEFASKYDPIRLAVEHEALREESLEAPAAGGGRRPFVSFTQPDHDLRHEELLQAGRPVAEDFLSRLGISRMGLIRNFRLCFFSFGYTRVSAVPVINNKHHTNMPVRLNLYQKVTIGQESAKHPVYTLTQDNEAIYVQLNEEIVRDWLIRIRCQEANLFETGSVGGRLLECVYPMNMFLEGLPKKSGGQQPYGYLATYTLLHTFAHHIARAISEFAGLDLGSIGEYIFPTDLSFVIYRSRMTMDLGNLSAMWRNNGLAFLMHLLSRKSLICGLGTLCAERGGACPDCLMMPEVSCIAHNRLLSRSVLNGIGAPEEDGYNSNLPSYFDVAQKGLEGGA